MEITNWWSQKSSFEHFTNVLFEKKHPLLNAFALVCDMILLSMLHPFLCFTVSSVQLCMCAPWFYLPPNLPSLKHNLLHLRDVTWKIWLNFHLKTGINSKWNVKLHCWKHTAALATYTPALHSLLSVSLCLWNIHNIHRIYFISGKILELCQKEFL